MNDEERRRINIDKAFDKAYDVFKKYEIRQRMDDVLFHKKDKTYIEN